MIIVMEGRDDLLRTHNHLPLWRLCCWPVLRPLPLSCCWILAACPSIHRTPLCRWLVVHQKPSCRCMLVISPAVMYFTPIDSTCISFVRDSVPNDVSSCNYIIQWSIGAADMISRSQWNSYPIASHVSSKPDASITRRISGVYKWVII